MDAQEPQTTMDLDTGEPILEKTPTFDKQKAIKRWKYSLLFCVAVVVVRVAIYYFFGH